MSGKKETNQIKLSVSGLRGRVDVELTEDILRQYLKAYIRVHCTLYEKWNMPRVMGVAMDTRESSMRWKHIVIDTLMESGYSVVDLNIMTTPSLLFAVKYFNMIGGIMITASHNPQGWNGLKFVDKGGVLLDPDKVKAMQQIFESGEWQCPPISDVPRLMSSPNGEEASRRHVEHVLNIMGPDLVKQIQQRRFKVAYDPVNGAACYIISYFLDQLQCETYAVHATHSPHFGRPPEPIANNLSDLQALVQQHSCDIGFASDPDGDRLSLVSELGQAVGEEYTLVLCVDEYLNQCQGDVVVNLSSSRMMDEVAQRHQATLTRVAVGEANVLQQMAKQHNPIGGEGSGGIIWPKVVSGRDSLSAISLILSGLIRRSQSLSDWVRHFTPYHLLKTSMNVTSKIALSQLLDALSKEYKHYSCSLLDGLRVDTPHFWFHIRPSNTEPIVRIFVEANSITIAQKQMQSLKKQCQLYLTPNSIS